MSRARIDRVYELIGQRIEELRDERELTQEELANACGLKRPSIALIEKGRQKIPIDRLYQVAHALGCSSLMDLLPDLRDAFRRVGPDGELQLTFDEGSEQRIRESPGVEKEAVGAAIAAAVKKVQNQRRRSK